MWLPYSNNDYLAHKKCNFTTILQKAIVTASQLTPPPYLPKKYGFNKALLRETNGQPLNRHGLVEHNHP